MSQTIFSDGIGYEGKVTLTLKGDKGRVLKSKTYKNNGTAWLFRFLGLCLIDSYEEAKKFLPNYILLLYNNGASPTDVEVRSLPRSYVQTPTISSGSKESQVKVVYSFEVARNEISGSFNQVALYGAGVTDTTDFSAYYYLLNSTGGFEALDPTADEWSATTVLLIEWELSLSNKNVVTNNNEGAQIENG